MIIAHLTDIEGNFAYFQKWAMHSKVIALSDNQPALLAFKPQPNQQTSHFVYGGDVCDKGMGDLQIANALTLFKIQHTKNVHLIAGNRDIKYRRFSYELDEKHIKTRLLKGASPHWRRQSKPRDYVVLALKEEGKTAPSQRDIETFVEHLSLIACQTLYLKWMLNETMGAGAYYNKPSTFEYRRQELAHLHNKKLNDIDDYQVTQSFIDAVKPDGVMTCYLKQTQLAAIIGDTLFVHGALAASDLGYVPASQAVYKDAHAWVEALNAWYHAQIDAWIKAPTEPHITPPGQSMLDQYVIFNPKSIVTSNWYQDGKLAPIDARIENYLNRAGIYRVICGHQSFSDFPLIIRSDKLEVIVADTSYSDVHAKNDNRGLASHALYLHQNEQESFVTFEATRKTGAHTHLVLPSSRAVLSGKNTSLLGHFTENGLLIRLNEHNQYVASQLDGFTIIDTPI